HKACFARSGVSIDYKNLCFGLMKEKTGQFFDQRLLILGKTMSECLLKLLKKHFVILMSR
ncbi:MAG: hypothetical protein UH641_01190, partial [Bacteroidales bacterium]|nr:hypothetical protein [Bacteroidales bacterium]